MFLMYAILWFGIINVIMIEALTSIALLYQEITFSLGIAFLTFGSVHYFTTFFSPEWGPPEENSSPPSNHQNENPPSHENLPAVIPIEKKPFNIVFQEHITYREFCGYKIKEIPPCFFCKHNIIKIAFTSNAEPISISTNCEKVGDDTVVWDNRGFSSKSLRLINGYPDQLDSDENWIFDKCKEFKPNLLLWQESHAIKLGEFEILGKTLSDGKK
jgi:hypothetical protein